jgi:hypothetical protein
MVPQQLQFSFNQDSSLNIVPWFVSEYKTYPWTYDFQLSNIAVNLPDDARKFPAEHAYIDPRYDVNEVIAGINGKVMAQTTDCSNYVEMYVTASEMPGIVIYFYAYPVEKKYVDSNREHYLKPVHFRNGIAHFISRVFIYYTPEAIRFIDKIISVITNCQNVYEQYYSTNECRLGVVCKNADGYYIAEKEFKEDSSNFYRFDLDLHYGTGFSDFHKKLLERINKRSKGIVLFHGYPGTGKTFYIRRLIKDIYRNPKKKIIVIPNALLDYLVTPEFLDFLRVYIQDFENLDLVLILEDAENLLRKREESNSFNSVSNILNLTDGILNDLVSIQIIATFNTELKNIDTAVLRAQRLLAKKQFKPLPRETAIQLAKSINAPLESLDENKKYFTLAEIYSLTDQQTDDVLIEDSSEEETLLF